MNNSIIKLNLFAIIRNSSEHTIKNSGIKFPKKKIGTDFGTEHEKKSERNSEIRMKKHRNIGTEFGNLLAPHPDF